KADSDEIEHRSGEKAVGIARVNETGEDADDAGQHGRADGDDQAVGDGREEPVPLGCERDVVLEGWRKDQVRRVFEDLLLLLEGGEDDVENWESRPDHDHAEQNGADRRTYDAANPPRGKIGANDRSGGG